LLLLKSYETDVLKKVRDKKTMLY